MRALILTFAMVAASAAACGEGDADQLRPGQPGVDAPGTPIPTDPAATPGAVDPSTCGGRNFVGFEGAELTSDRPVATLGVDRGRMKPYGVLAAEYKRVLGAAPASLAPAAETYGNPPPRWSDEPTASGVVLQTGFSIAFDGCLSYTAAAPEYSAAPSASSAATACAAMARRFWSRTASPDQLAPCIDVAVKTTIAETNPRRRWAYACATVLNAAGFTTY